MTIWNALVEHQTETVHKLLYMPVGYVV